MSARAVTDWSAFLPRTLHPQAVVEGSYGHTAMFCGRHAFTAGGRSAPLEVLP